MFWVARRAKYPYVTMQDWWTRYHLLLRKLDRQGGHPTWTDRRAAVALHRCRTAAGPAPSSAPRLSAAKEILMGIIDGYRTA